MQQQLLLTNAKTLMIIVHNYVEGVSEVSEQCDQIGRFLHFGQPFKAGGNNYFTQIAHIVRQFL